MTLRELYEQKNPEVIRTLEKVPFGYSIKRAEEESLISLAEGNALLWLFVRWSNEIQKLSGDSTLQRRV